MANYVELNGVRTWFDESGEGDPVVLLHPGGTDARAFGRNLPSLAEKFHVYTLERRGHGHTPDVDGPMSFNDAADDTIAFLEQVVNGPARLLGYSDGAIVALLVALKRPDLVSRMVFVSGVFHLDGWLPGVIDPDIVPPDFMAASYGEISPDGIDHWPAVVKKLADLHQIEPTISVADLAKINVRTLLMFGDDDEIGLEHVLELYRSLPNAELAIIPGTSHGVIVEKPDICNSIILDFLSNDAIQTFAPVRRAQHSDQ